MYFFLCPRLINSDFGVLAWSAVGVGSRGQGSTSRAQEDQNQVRNLAYTIWEYVLFIFGINGFWFDDLGMLQFSVDFLMQ